MATVSVIPHREDARSVAHPDPEEGGGAEGGDREGGTAILGAQVLVMGELRRLDLGIRDGIIVELADGLQGSYQTVVRAKGLVALPGVIDTQVHFREPGMTHKEDLASGSNAAAAGGVTSFFEMPNTKPATTTPELWADKVARAAGRCRVDHAFYAGATRDNAASLRQLEGQAGFAGVKVFMGSSTGSLLVDDDAGLAQVLRAGKMRVAVHAEDEPTLRRLAAAVPGTQPIDHQDRRDVSAAVLAVQRLLDLALETTRPVHVLHVSSAEECELLRRHPARRFVSAEVTPQHLLLAGPECYQRLGNLAVMNPPIRSERDRAALWQALRDGVLTLIGTDHAPHTIAEKSLPYPGIPSGMPGVQTLLPLLLDQVAQGTVSLAEVALWTAQRPAHVFQIRGKGGLLPGLDGDIALVDLNLRRELTPQLLQSRCGWSPWLGQKLQGWPIMTVVRGQLVWAEDQPVGAPIGRPLQLVKPLLMVPGAQSL